MQLINNILHFLDFLGGANTKVKPRWGMCFERVVLMLNLSFSSYNMGAETKYFL